MASGHEQRAFSAERTQSCGKFASGIAFKVRELKLKEISTFFDE
jgi:hypothetical protein